MTASGWKLNRFERFLFRAAVGLAALLIVVRIGAVLLLAFLRHAISIIPLPEG
jgi:hypothetical protein